MAEEDIKAFQIRLPIHIYEDLSESAEDNLRSLNAEILVILRKFFENRGEFANLYRLPPDIIKRVEKSAKANRRSVNDEVVVLLEAALASDGGPTSAAGLAKLLEIRLDRIERRLPPEDTA